MRAREQDVSLTGPDGLHKQLTKTVLETTLNQEMTERLRAREARPPGSRSRAMRATGPSPRRC